MHQLFRSRRSIRKFTDRKVEDEKLQEILNAAMVAPSYCNQKLYQLIVVKDKEILSKLSIIGNWVDFISGCNVAIVVVSKENAGWIEDGALVNGWMMLEAVNQGLATCWADVKDGKELDNTDREPLVRELLGIPNDFRVLNMLAIGYANQKIKDHSESEYKASRVHFEKW